MSDALIKLVSSRLPIAGLAAYSIHSFDRVVATECFSNSLYHSTVEQMLTDLVRSGRTLLPPGDSGAHYCWTFDCLRVYVAARTDGVCLALMVENSPGVQTVRIQEMLNGFAEFTEN